MMLNYFLFTFVLLFSSIANAIIMHAELSAGNLRWSNANARSGGQYYTPSQWSVVNNLPPTNEWVPGGLLNSTSSTLTLISEGTVIDVPFEVIGFEYNTGSVMPSNGTLQSGSVCSKTDSSGKVIRVTGVGGCLYENSLTYGGTFSPYSFIRPIVGIDTVALTDAFNGFPKGVYRGTVNVSNFYDYVVPSSGGITARRVKNIPITLEVDYEPSFISSVAINGDRELTVFYDLDRNVVRGETILVAQAQGWFTDGLSISLLPNRTNYALTGPSMTQIPYSIECLDCSSVMLVNEGNVVTTETKRAGANSASLGLSIRVSFQDVDLNSVESGLYSDNFILVFEPDV